MVSSTPRLDSLPPEILKRIATHSPTDSLLVLISVSRQFYATLHDPAVYKAVIRNGNTHAPTCVDRTPTPWLVRSWDVDFNYNLTQMGGKWDLSFLPSSTPVTTYARWALADLRAREWIANQNFPISDGYCSDDEREAERQLGAQPIPCEEIVKFAPHLITQGYPLVQHILRGNLLQRCASGHGENPHRETLCFILALTVLDDASQAVESQSETQKQYRVDDILVLKEQLQRSIGFLNEGLYHPTSPYSTFAIFFTHEILARCQKLRAAARWIIPPKADRIPLRELLDFGLPFTNLPPGGKLPMIISRSFLEDGEWVGYYSLRMDIMGASIDPPMKRIRFQTEEVDDHGKIMLKSRGVDMVGGFDLTGWITTEGKVRLNKDYAVGPQWDWDGMLGPLGIIGSWASSGRAHGMFWIWKKEWSE